MDSTAALVAGMIATAPMTAFMLLAPRLHLPRFNIMRILGTFFTPDETVALPMGAVLHFGIGSLFGLAYAVLWNLGIGRASAGWGLIYGALHGLLAVITMLLLARHPRLGDLRMLPALLVDWLAHLVFGVCMALLYAAFRR